MQVVRELGKGSNLRTAVLVGGDAMDAQFAELAATLSPQLYLPARLSLAAAACRWCVSWSLAAGRHSLTLLCTSACFNHCHWLSLHAGGV
jgi:hypothetical protein